MTLSSKPIPRYRPKSKDGSPSVSEELKQENRALVKSTPKPPKDLASLFAEPLLVGEERREDYENLFSALAAAVNPADAIAWVYVRDFADLTWEIRRERWLKHQAIEIVRGNTVKKLLEELLMPPPIDDFCLNAAELESDPERVSEIEHAQEEIKKWERDPKARRRIDKELASEGYNATYILTTTLTDRTSGIDDIDRRISAYESRRNVMLREIDRHSESMARRLDLASSDIIDGEFTEAVE